MRHLTFLIPLFAAIAGLYWYGPIPQDLSYHDFANQRMWQNIPNAADVLSNIAFALVGLLGVWGCFCRRHNQQVFHKPVERYPAYIFFWGVLGLGFGSAYYHLHPDNTTLVWDRLAMTIGFMALFAMIVMERINMRLGIFLLPVFIILGVLSIYYWHQGELVGKGDLRPYALVQFYPMIAIPLMLMLYPARYSGSGYLLEVLVFYVLAKICEATDDVIFDTSLTLVSGHTLKHLFAAMACYSVLRYIKHRKYEA